MPATADRDGQSVAEYGAQEDQGSLGSDRQRVHYCGEWYPARKRMRPIEDSLDAVAPEFEDIGPINAAKCGLPSSPRSTNYIWPARLRT